MIKFSKRQLNTLLDAVHNLYIADNHFMEYTRHPKTDDSDAYANYKLCDKYMEGVQDALSILVYRDTVGYSERYHIYPMEAIPDRRDDNGNAIEIMTVDALERRVIYNLFEDDSSYSKKYAKKLEEGYKKYYKEVYSEDV